ncbi:hypothetical protein R6Q57_017296 [Mikania cordata]
MANPMAVVGSNFLAPRPVDLIIDKKLWNGNFTITDVNGNVVFKVNKKFMSLRERRVLFDAAGNPILSFQKKKLLTLSDGNVSVTDVNGNVMFEVKGELISLHDRRVLLDAAGNPVISFQKKMGSIQGSSSDSKDLIFSAKQSSLIQLKTSLEVFLARNENENACDFKVKGSSFDRSCTIYAGDGTTIIAQMHKKHTIESVALGKDTFSVTVYPNVDYAFIVALVVILHEINEDNNEM